MSLERKNFFELKTFTEKRSKLLYGFLRNYNSKATQEAYRSDLELFLRFLLKQFQKTEFSFEHAHAVAYKEYLLQKNYGTNSVNRKLASVSAYVDYLVVEGMKDKNPFDRVKRFPKMNVGKTPAISIGEVRETLAKIDTENITGKMRHALLMVLFNTGIRVSEVCNLKLGSLMNDEFGLFITFQIKGGFWHKSYLPENTADSIYLYLKERELRYGDLKKSDSLFVSFSNGASIKLNRSSVNYIFKQVFKESANNIYPHVSRATFITEVIKRHGLSSAQKRVGHQDPRTTNIYDRGLEVGHITIV